MYNELAMKLNQVIETQDANIYKMLSELGKSMFFPKGIVSQGIEAQQKAHRFNATIGMATEDRQPMHLSLFQEKLSAYDPKDLYPYAPPAGKMELRQEWKKKLVRDNPSLANKEFSLPIVTSSLTHGLSIVGDLFLEEGDTVVVPEKFWDNYNLTFDVRHRSHQVTYPLFTANNTFNVKGMEEAIFACTGGKVVIVLNFPHNPTGYTPSEQEVTEILTAIEKAADAGISVIAVADDAYFGLVYEGSFKESIFARLVGMHPRVLPIKIDGATKEHFAWGFRIGFLTFGVTDKAVQDALENKVMGAIRGSVSSSSHPGQTFVLDALQNPNFEQQRQRNFTVMESRWKRVKEIVSNEKYRDAFEPYPFNSGYFVCLKLKSVKAERLREHLLQRYGVGVISIGETDIRIAFSCVDEADLGELFELVYQGCKELG
ncbi:hypothetical protein CFK37_09185 [Virgibacillus phasianinus]|uniref:Aminotransferase class I/classII large domain-containing protein n=2 Tax=Virgibacillus phasianinus TaxID=2017483 RepID=A0A220U8A0_9BACI|nr:hypothetical protein CFK37_09185 [Virgibacillus phasianinus]